jgi:hypothetical protein
MPATEQETTMTDTKAVEKALNRLDNYESGNIPCDWKHLPAEYDRERAAARTALAALLAERDKLRTALKAATDYDEAVKAFVYLCSCPTIGQPAGTRLAHEAQLFRAARAQTPD